MLWHAQLLYGEHPALHCLYLHEKCGQGSNPQQDTVPLPDMRKLPRAKGALLHAPHAGQDLVLHILGRLVMPEDKHEREDEERSCADEAKYPPAWPQLDVSISQTRCREGMLA